MLRVIDILFGFCAAFASCVAVHGSSRPAPINCEQRGWSSWTTCNSCTDKKFRFRYLERPSQFGGSECLDSQWGTLACPRATTPCLEADLCGESFTCTGSGRCISQSLRCNGEADCEDDSDEEGCERVTSRQDKCSTLLPIPGAERGTQGFNMLTGEFVDKVLDPKYYGGKCEYIYNGAWRKFTYDPLCENLRYTDDEKNYRKPYNYHTYRFVAHAISEGVNEYYEDMVDLLKARKTQASKSFGFTVGIYYVEGGLSSSRESEFLSNLTQYKSQDLGFVRLWSKVQTAQFKMRSDKLMLHDDMFVSFMDLPEQYDFGMYSRFFNVFGTHYVTEGSMGGTLEYVMVVNKTSMASLGVEAHQVGRCFGISIGLAIPVKKGAEVNVKASGEDCKKKGAYMSEPGRSSSVIEDIITLVKGGIPHSSSGILALRDADMYRKWGATLQYNPTLIDYETLPIYELLRFSTAAEHGQVAGKLANMKRAWDEYLLQFNSCRCAPCRHNGIPVLKGNSCFCVCKEGYMGKACEETLRGDRRTDGAWSCWGSWSSCQSGSRSRTRLCNNPSPHNGGAACLGSSTQTQRC